MIFNTWDYFLLFLVPAAILFRAARPPARPWIAAAYGCLFFVYFSYTQLGGLLGAACLAIFLWESFVSRFYKPASWVCMLGVTQTILFLCVFKYRNFLSGIVWPRPAENPVYWKHAFLPLGISFFTFEFLHYAWDRYRAKTEAGNLGEYMAFILFFPTMVTFVCVNLAWAFCRSKNITSLLRCWPLRHPRAGELRLAASLRASSKNLQPAKFRHRVSLIQGDDQRQCTSLCGSSLMDSKSPVVLSNNEIIGNHDVLYYLDPEYARRFYQLSLRDSAEFEVVRRADMLADRSAVWAKVELFRRRLAAQGMPPVRENRFGRVSDFSLLESQDAQAFASQVAAASKDPFTSSVQEILRYAARSGARVVFIEMPMPSRHRRLFYETNSWSRYRAHLRALASTNAADYIDASHWITDDALFSDHIHLNSAGAAVFTRQLATAIREGDLMRRAETSVSASSVRRPP